MTGTIVNTAAIIVGGSIGLLLKGRISDKFADNIIRAIGLCVCIIGISGALSGDKILLAATLTIGAIVGELLRIDGHLNNLGRWLQIKMSGNNEKSTFAEGYVAATLLFCIGAMAIVGSLDSGLRGDHSIIFTKSVLDAVSSVILASTFGVGVLFSAVSVFIYQGSIEFFAGHLQNVITDGLIVQISAVGGVMILAIGFNMVFGKRIERIKAANLLPAFIFAVGYYYLFINVS